MDLKKIQPTGSHVLIKPYESAKKSTSGLVMENTSNTSNAPVRGTILACGAESKYKKSQEILFRRFSTDKLAVITPKGEVEVSLVEDDDIIAIIK